MIGRDLGRDLLAKRRERALPDRITVAGAQQSGRADLVVVEVSRRVGGGAARAAAIVNAGRCLRHAGAAKPGDDRSRGVLTEQRDNCPVSRGVYQILVINVPLSGSGLAIGVETNLRDGLAGNGGKAGAAILPLVG